MAPNKNSAPLNKSPLNDPVGQRLSQIGQEFGHGFALELTRIENALAALGDPHKKLPPVFHVAGTNGKGSTCAFLRAIAEAAGLKAHVFTSPHLVRANERVRLAGRLVDNDAFIAAIERVGATGVTLTYFEVITAAAFLLFAETPGDVVILEVGLGGLVDATNVIARPAVSVITPVDLDHMAFLGDTIGKIAFQKAGILKSGAPGVIARQQPDGLDAIELQALRVNAPLSVCGRDWDCYAQHGRLIVQTQDRLIDLPTPSLIGAHQMDNAGLAVTAMLAWRDARISDDALARGVARAQWPARMQPLQQGPLAEIAAAHGAELWLDGGHNPHAGRALAATLTTLNVRAPRDTILISAILKTKDPRGFLAPLQAHARRLFAVPLTTSQNALSPEDYCTLAEEVGMVATPARDMTDAITRACRESARARIVICGSLYLAGAVLADAGGVT
jgi:dihydrofolate synthase/folylpolyglutamate synthase